jgi:hypothetical protein
MTIIADLATTSSDRVVSAHDGYRRCPDLLPIVRVGMAVTASRCAVIRSRAALLRRQIAAACNLDDYDIGPRLRRIGDAEQRRYWGKPDIAEPSQRRE